MVYTVNSDNMGYRMQIHTILDEKVTVIEVLRKIWCEGRPPCYIGRSSSVVEGPPYYPAVLRFNEFNSEDLKFLTDPSFKKDPYFLKRFDWKKITKKFWNKLIGVLDQEGLPRKVVEIEVLLHHSMFYLGYGYRNMRSMNEEEETNQKLEKFTDNLVQILAQHGELSRVDVKDEYHDFFVFSEMDRTT